MKNLAAVAPAFLRLKRLTERDELEDNLALFFREAWSSFDPDIYTHGWHLDAIAEHLTAVTNGEIRKLLINVPPRHSKSNLVSIAWPAWTWARHHIAPLSGPQVRFLCLSYSLDLSIQHATTARRLLESPWYKKYWGDWVKVAWDRDTKAHFDTTAGGARVSSSFGGSTLGRGGDIKIIDDPHKVDEVESDIVREQVLREYDETLRSRVTDPRTAAEVIIMQRLAQNDLSGHVLDDSNEFVHLMLPAEFDERRKCVTVLGWEDPRKKEGELLWPERFGPKELAPHKKLRHVWAGQYQQLPAPRGGSIIKTEYWQLWKRSTFPQLEFILGSLDTAYTAKEENDASALTIWGVFRDNVLIEEMGSESLWMPRTTSQIVRPVGGNPKIILLYAWQERLEFNELIQRVIETCTLTKNKTVLPRFPVDKLLIEAKASGISVGQELHRMFRGTGQFGIELINPKLYGDKIARVHAVQHLFSDGMIFAPDKAWADEVIDQCAMFPRGSHDDLVDSTSQALRFLRDTGFALRREEFSVSAEEELMYRSPSEIAPLYDV